MSPGALQTNLVTMKNLGGLLFAVGVKGIVRQPVENNWWNLQVLELCQQCFMRYTVKCFLIKEDAGSLMSVLQYLMPLIYSSYSWGIVVDLATLSETMLDIGEDFV